MLQLPLDAGVYRRTSAGEMLAMLGCQQGSPSESRQREVLKLPRHATIPNRKQESQMWRLQVRQSIRVTKQ